MLPETSLQAISYYVYGFAAVAAFILLIACINYVNLAIARGQNAQKKSG